MNFFKKVISLRSKKLIKSTSYYDLYDEECSDIHTSKFEYKNYEVGKSVIDLLKNIKHPNILSITKHKDAKKDTYIRTHQLSLIDDLFKKPISYQHYIICKLADVIIFLRRCNIAHNSLHPSNFYTFDGMKLILCGFEEHSRCLDYQNDDYLFFDLLKSTQNLNNISNQNNYKYLFREGKEIMKEQETNQIEINLCNISDSDTIIRLLKSTRYENIDDFILRNKTCFVNNIYMKYENLELKFKLLSTTQRIELLNFIIDYKKQWTHSMKEKIIKTFLPDLSRDSKEYKEKILVVIFELDLENYDQIIPILFKYPDSDIRYFLLYNCEVYFNKFSMWGGKVFDALILGLRCSDKKLQFESMKFINKVSNELNEKCIKETIQTLQLISKEINIMNEGLKLVENQASAFKDNVGMVKEIYKLLTVYLGSIELRDKALEIIHNIYEIFDVRSVQLELTPLLLTFLSDEDNQSKSFLVIEDLVNHLKKNKEKIINKDWSIKKLGSLMNKVNLKVPGLSSGNVSKNKIDNSEKKIEKEKSAKKEGSDEWDEDW